MALLGNLVVLVVSLQFLSWQSAVVCVQNCPTNPSINQVIILLSLSPLSLSYVSCLIYTSKREKEEEKMSQSASDMAFHL
ncbi:hypothetical protein QBC38DRAFT_199799 [Podospora fimiseda]|uniref:Uncharacterized protein n=1 Tax=Podospora fimiseda TaxID=252190 RepID=A0AAN7BPH9_9PEZI|nr:hypothetical protein QBC38DRAFT_199799 [Podospora fimiseda]